MGGMTAEETAAGIEATTLEAAQANVLNSAKLYCDFRNDDLKTIFLTAFNNWKTNVDAGRIDNTNPPKPQKKLTVGVGADGWAYVVTGNEPVCEMPPIPEDHSKTQQQLQAELPPMNIDIGVSADNGSGVWFAVGPKDSWPVGKKTPPGTRTVEGITGTFLRVGTAVGKGWYERVA